MSSDPRPEPPVAMYMNFFPGFGNQAPDKNYAFAEAAETAKQHGRPVEVWQRIAIVKPY